jgi:hypothetical protein
MSAAPDHQTDEETCACCGENRSSDQFEDGLRCKLRAEAQDEPPPLDVLISDDRQAPAPYVVNVRRRGSDLPTDIVRQAVVGLEQTRAAAALAVDRAWGPYATPRTTNATDDGRHYVCRAQALRLGSLGGVIELPDDTLITVVPADWAALVMIGGAVGRDLADSASAGDVTAQQALLDSFNLYWSEKTA